MKSFLRSTGFNRAFSFFRTSVDAAARRLPDRALFAATTSAAAAEPTVSDRSGEAPPDKVWFILDPHLVLLRVWFSGFRLVCRSGVMAQRPRLLLFPSRHLANVCRPRNAPRLRQQRQQRSRLLLQSKLSRLLQKLLWQLARRPGQRRRVRMTKLV